MLERELYSVLENTADAAFAVDEHGMVRSWNHSAEKLFGHRATEILDKPCAALFQGRGNFGSPICSEHCSIIDCAVHHRETPNYDMEVKTRNGRRIWVNVSILVFRDDRTGHTLVVHLTRDISQRKRAEGVTSKFVQLARQVSALPQDGGPMAPTSPLTEQEGKILRLFAQGKSPRSIAEELEITPRTLRNHLHHANQKLGTRNRLEAVMQATRRGLI